MIRLTTLTIVLSMAAVPSLALADKHRVGEDGSDTDSTHEMMTTETMDAADDPQGEAKYTAEEADPAGATPRPGINVGTTPEPGQGADTDVAPDYDADEIRADGATPRPGQNVGLVPDPGQGADTDVAPDYDAEDTVPVGTTPRPGENVGVPPDADPIKE